MTAAQGGDKAALDELLRRHYDRLFGLCRRITGNDADAQDATQEALIALVKGLPRFDGRAAFGTWAYRVATNACLDELRRKQRRPTPVEIDNDRVPEADGPSLDTTITDRLGIDEALQHLAPEFRTAVVLRDVAGLDYATIADVLHVPPGTVRSRIARGRTALAAELGNRTDRSNVQAKYP